MDRLARHDATTRSRRARCPIPTFCQRRTYARFVQHEQLSRIGDQPTNEGAGAMKRSIAMALATASPDCSAGISSSTTSSRRGSPRSSARRRHCCSPLDISQTLGVLPALVKSSHLARAFGYAPSVNWKHAFFTDEYNHLSIREGIRASSTPSFAFKHVDMNDLEAKALRVSGADQNHCNRWSVQPARGHRTAARHDGACRPIRRRRVYRRRPWHRRARCRPGLGRRSISGSTARESFIWER